MSSPYIYLRGLKNVDHSVFCVEDGQKTYRDPQFSRRPQPFSSGQQVKRSILQETLEALGETTGPVEFLWKQEKKGGIPQEDIAVQPCDPGYTDQLLGGYMKASSKNTQQNEDESFVVKRRSPLSISALRPLHPLLANVDAETGTFDRTEDPNSTVKLLGPKGQELSVEEMEQELEKLDKHLPKRKFLNAQSRANGLFIYDIAIDLRRLFCVSTVDISKGEPEIYNRIKEKLKQDGWKESTNAFGPCLVCPKEKRDKIIDALATALTDWRITSNQARTFSLMEPLAYAISDKAYAVSGAIRGELREDTETDQAVPRIDKSSGADIFLGANISGFVKGEYGSAGAVDEAKAKLKEMMEAFPFEEQMEKSN